MEQKRVLITICGRAGSKGFKNKNLKIFDGHPLSYYSLSAAELFIRSRPDLAVDVCLNTDSGLLIDVITKKYPEVTVLPRPEELCGDIVPKMPVYQYSLRQMEQKKGYEYDTLIDLDITSPLRQTGDIEGAYEVKASRPDLDLIFSVTPSRRTPYMNMAKLAGDHVEKVIDHHNTARQQTPPVFDINASIYVFERRFLIENTTGFVYDAESATYKMLHADGTPQLDANSGQQAAFDNLLVLFSASALRDDEQTFDYDLSMGGGVWLNGGHLWYITWTQGTDTTFQFYDADGELLTLNAGRSYLALVSSVTGQELAVTNSAGENLIQ